MNPRQLSYFFLFVCTIFIWVIHNFAILSVLPEVMDGSASSFAYRGSIGYAMDNTSYGTLIRYSADHPSLYRPDNLVLENNGKIFSDGNLVIQLCAFVYKWVGSLDIMVLLTSFISIFLGCFLTRKILAVLGIKGKAYFFLVISLLFLCNFDDWLGVNTFLNGFNSGHLHTSFGLHLGYSGRFPYSSVSIVFFLFWIWRLVSYLKNSSLINIILLSLATVLLQYIYFYYWTFAIVISVGVLVWSRKPFKEVGVFICLYAIGTLHFWIGFFEFNSTEFAAEYLYRVKGNEYYPAFTIHLLGYLITIFFFRHTSLSKVSVLVGIPIVCQLIIRTCYLNFQMDNWAFWLGRLVVAILLVVLAIFTFKKVKFEKVSGLFLLGYWTIFFVINLKFFVGYNVQPYHWVYASFYPLLVFAFGSILSTILKREFVAWGIGSLVLLMALYNSIAFTRINGGYFNLSKEEVEVMNVISRYDQPVLAGNNFPLLITAAAQTKSYLLTGTSNCKISGYHESYYRLIRNFKLIGYTDEGILDEYQKYSGFKAYQELYLLNNDSLKSTWPDNTVLAAEAIHHYFNDPSQFLPQLRQELEIYNEKMFQFNANLAVLYLPTYQGNMNSINGNVVYNSENYRVVSLKN